MADNTGDALYFEEEVSVSQTWMMSNVQNKYHHCQWKKKYRLSSKKTMNKTVKAVCCGNCTLYKTALNARTRALGGDVHKYKCYQVLFATSLCLSKNSSYRFVMQGEKDNFCCKAGKCGDAGNQTCMKLEAGCTPGGSIESSYIYAMNTRDLKPDQNYLRLTKCLSFVGCVKKIVNSITPFGPAIDCLVFPFKRAMVPAMAVQLKKECDDPGANDRVMFTALVPLCLVVGAWLMGWVPIETGFA